MPIQKKSFLLLLEINFPEKKRKTHFHGTDFLSVAKSSTWGSSFPNPKSQLVQCPNRETMGYSPFFLATATSKRLLCRLCYCFLWPMRKHLTGSSYITGTPSPHLHLVQTPPNAIMCVWATPISIPTTLKKKVQIPVSCSVVYYSCWHAGAYTVEPVNTDTSGSKKFCKIIGLAILPGKGQMHHTLHSHLLNSCSLQWMTGM